MAADKFTTLAQSMPVANARLQKQQQDANALAMQQTIAKAQPGTSNVRIGQQVGAAVTGDAGKQQVQQAAQQVQQQANIGQAGLQQQASDIKNRLAALQQGVQAQGIDQKQQLFQHAQQLENKAFNDRMQFRKDELGRTEFNDKQLADYARISGLKDEQLRDYAQTAQLAYQRDLQITEHAANLINEQLQFESRKRTQDQDQALISKLNAQKIALDRAIEAKQAEAANNSQMWSGILGIVGTVVGGYFGGPAGAGAGYSIGSGVGSAAGRSMTDTTVSKPSDSDVSKYEVK